MAGDWFNKGVTLVNTELFAEALGAFNCSLRMIEHPATILNAARAAKLAGINRAALRLYQRYLELYPQGDKAAQARDQIAILGPLTKAEAKRDEPSTEEPVTQPPVVEEHSSEDHPAAPSPSPPAEQAVTASVPPAAEQPESSPTAATKKLNLKTIGWISIVAGGAFAVTGFVLQGLSAKAAREGEQEAYYAQYLEKKEDKEAFQTGATIGYIAGALALGAGITMVVLGRESAAEPEIQVGLYPGGISLGGRF